MKKALKFLAFGLFTLLLFFLVAAVAFYHLVSVGEFRRFLIQEIEQRTALTVRLGEGDLKFGRVLGIAFRDVAILEPNGSETILTAERITARVALWPLFRRRLVFYAIDLEKPAAHVTRDPDGKIRLLERLLNLPFLKSQDTQFSLDLRAIKIVGGNVEFRDHVKRALAGTTTLRGFDLRLNRIRGQALRQFFAKVVSKRPHPPNGTALDFDLKTTLAREGQTAQIHAGGTMVFPDDRLEFDNAWWNVKAQINAMPIAVFQSIGEQLPLKSLSGSMDSSVQLEGDPKERLHVQAQIAFKELAVDAPEIFSAPLQPGEGHVVLDMNWKPAAWDLSRFELRSKDKDFLLRGAVRAISNHDHQVELNLTTPPVPIATMKQYLPMKWLASPQLENMTAAVQQGEIRFTKAGINAKWSDLNRMTAASLDDRVWFDGELRNVSAQFPGGYLPLRSLEGRITLERGVLSLVNLQGDYGQSRFGNAVGSYRISSGSLQLQARGEVDLAEIREQARQGLLSAPVAKAAAYVHEIAGRSKFDLGLSKTPEAAPVAQGKLTLDGARLQTDDLSLSDIRGDIAFTPADIKAERILASISGSPVEIQLALKDYGSENATFDLGVGSRGMRAGVVSRLLLNSGSVQDPGLVRGSIRYSGPLTANQRRKFTADLDLVNVQIDRKPLLQPLRQLSGRIKIDDAGIDFQKLNGLLVGFPARFNGQWRYGQKTQLVFDFSAPNLDVTYLLSQIDPETTDFYNNLVAEGTISLAKGSVKAFEFSDFKSAVVIDHRVWRFNNPIMQSDGGTVQGVATLFDKPDVPGFSVTPKLQSVPIQSVLKWFDMSNKEITGKIILSGHFESAGKDALQRKRNLAGWFNLKIEDGTIHRLRVLIQILNLLDLSRWFTFRLPDLNKEGISFRRISGDFKVAKGVYTTDNLLVDSDDLRMTGSGKLDPAKEEIDFLVAVRPFAGIDTGLNYIPIIGRGIAAIKNSFLVASFHITGSIDNPTVVPAPLSTVSEWFLGVLGIPKNMIGLGGGDGETHKDEVHDDEKAPSSSP